MSLVLGINAVFHDPAAALVRDGQIVAAAEEERFSRRKHGKPSVPFSTWELPEQSARWCLRQAGAEPGDLDAVAYSYDPELASDEVHEWEWLRTLYARRAPLFLRAALPGLDPDIVRFVPHHIAHAASAALAAPMRDSAVLVCDGRGETRSHWAGTCSGGELTELAAQELPHSLGLFYSGATEHLGFKRDSDEYKVMALASYGEPTWIDEFRELVYPTGDGGFRVEKIDWDSYTPRGEPDADLAASIQLRLEEVLLDLAGWLHEQSGQPALTMAGGVALNCVANSRIFRESPFERVWVQPAAGDAGTALGGALQVAAELDGRADPMETASLGRRWTDEEIRESLENTHLRYEKCEDIAEVVAESLARDEVVAWFQGRSEYGPRALGNRSLLAHPGRPGNLDRLNAIKGREKFRPVAPMVLGERAAEIFDGGPLPSPYMLFTHRVAPAWRDRIPAVTHVDGSARVQTVEPSADPLTARMLAAFERLTGVPVVINTSLNTAGRPMVDSPRDALECFGSAPVDVLAIGSFLIRRSG